MADQDIAQSYGVTPQEASNLIVAPNRTMPRENPYVPQSVQQDQPAQAPQQAPAPGLFDSVPFHTWLAKNAKDKYGADPWNLSDDQINKSVNDYAEGPLRTIIAHQHANGRYTGSDAALKDKIDHDVNYYKMLAQQEIEGNIPQIRGHFQSLKPPATPQSDAPDAQAQQNTQGILPNAANALSSGVQSALGAGAMVLGGIPQAIGSSPVLSPLLSTNPEARKQFDNLTLGWQDYFEGIAKKGFDNSRQVPTPGNSLMDRAAYTVGSLPAAIATFGLNQSFSNAAKGMDEGEDPNKIKRDFAIDAATNIALAKIPGGNVLARSAKGAALAPVINNANALLKGEKTPDTVDNFLSALFGAGFAAALGRRPNAPKTPEGTPNATQTNNAPTTEAENLAKSVSGGSEGGNTAAPAESASAAGNQKPLSPETQSILDGHDLQMAETPGGKSKTPQERWNSKEVQDLYNGALKDVPVDERPAFTDAFKKQWADIHDVNPDQMVTAKTESAAPADTSGEDALAAAAQENVSANEGAGRNVEGLLAEPIKTQVRGLGGKVTNKSVPVEFQNPTDQLAYLYKHGDEQTRPLISDELIKRGVPTERIQEYADKVDKDVSSSVNALKHKVTLSDRGFTTKPEVQSPLRKPRSPKA